MARLLHKVPPSALFPPRHPDISSPVDEDEEEEEGNEGEGGGKASSLEAAVLPLVRQHGLTRAELVLRVSECEGEDAGDAHRWDRPIPVCVCEG